MGYTRIPSALWVTSYPSRPCMARALLLEVIHQRGKSPKKETISPSVRQSSTHSLRPYGMTEARGFLQLLCQGEVPQPRAIGVLQRPIAIGPVLLSSPPQGLQHHVVALADPSFHVILEPGEPYQMSPITHWLRPPNGRAVQSTIAPCLWKKLALRGPMLTNQVLIIHKAGQFLAALINEHIVAEVQVKESKGSWTSTCRATATAWLSGARAPEKRSPNQGGRHARLGHSLSLPLSTSLCAKTQARVQKVAPHSAHLGHSRPWVALSGTLKPQLCHRHKAKRPWPRSPCPAQLAGWWTSLEPWTKPSSSHPWPKPKVWTRHAGWSAPESHQRWFETRRRAASKSTSQTLPCPRSALASTLSNRS